MKQLTLYCHNCRQVWAVDPPLGRRDECPSCHADAKVCLNCRHFDPGAHHECREDQAEWVKEKNQGNFCGWFEPRGGPGAETEAAKAKGKLGQLFKDASAAASPKPAPGLEAALKRFLDAKK